MNKRELQTIERELADVHRAFHMCGLDAISAKAMGLKPGRLCDDCRSNVAAAMTRIKATPETVNATPECER